MRLHCAKWPCNAGKRVDAAFGALDSSTRDRFKRQKTPLGMNSRALSGVLQTFPNSALKPTRLRRASYLGR